MRCIKARRSHRNAPVVGAKSFQCENQVKVPEGVGRLRQPWSACVVSICAGIHAIPRRQRIVAVNHGVHGREIHRHLSSDARPDHVHR